MIPAAGQGWIQSHRFQQFSHALCTDFPDLLAGQGRDIGDVLFHGHMGEQPHTLNGVADAAAQFGNLPVGLGHVLDRLAQRLGVDMPVTGTMYSVLYEGFAPREAVQALMGRQLKEE